MVTQSNNETATGCQKSGKRTHEPKDLAGLWRSYVNEFISVAKFAQFYGMNEPVALRVIRRGRYEHHANIQRVKLSAKL